MPIFLFETTSLGVAFSVTRWTTNMLVIVALAAVIKATLPAPEKKMIVEKQMAVQPKGSARRG